MKESDLFNPVKLWLQQQGYKVFAEMYGHDVVAVKGQHLVVVELKRSLTGHLLRQCGRAYFADKVYAAVPTNPSEKSLGLHKRSYAEIGILQVRDAVVVLCDPDDSILRHQKSEWTTKRHDRICGLLNAWEPDETIGGVPCGVNEGPAKKVLRLVREHRAHAPNAKWRDLYRIIPNHYASYKSMQQSMGKCEKFERIRDRKLAEAGAK